MRRGFLAGLAIAIGCLTGRGYECEGDEECLESADGVCAADAWCAYPNDDCDSGLEYGPHAPPSVAGECVERPQDDGVADGATSSSDDTAGSGDGDEDSGDSGEPEPVDTCADGVVDPGEDCDDGNREPGDGCHPLCVDPGSPAWTATYDGEAHSEDRGYAVTVDGDANAIYVAGFTTVDGDDYDILIQRWRLDTGTLVWTQAIDGGALETDQGEHIALDPQGNLVVVGMVTNNDQSTDAWLAKLDPNGESLWQITYDGGLDDKGQGVDVLADGSIVVVGYSEQADYTPIWVQRYQANGMAMGDPILHGDMGFSEGIDVVAQGMEYQLTGRRSDPVDTEVVWTGRYQADGTMQWEHGLSIGSNGNFPRGVGQDFAPDGGSAIGGVIGNDLLFVRYDAAGMPSEPLIMDGPEGAHDEAADVNFSADGTYVVVGFLDFRTEGFARSDSWVRRYDANGAELWTDRFEGAAKEIDKALGSELTVLDSVVVVGYETVPGQARDVWLRRYAL